MFKFFKGIRFQLLSGNKFKKYLVYAVGEIILVVIGILIALKINNLNSDRLLKLSEIKSYENIKQQLIDDQKELKKVKAFNNYHAKVYEYANNIIAEKNYNLQDSLALCAMRLSWYSDFHRSGNLYETLANSGDLKLLKNEEIPSKLQKLEMTYIFANKLEDMHWELIINNLAPEIRGVINYATFKPVKPEKLYSIEMQNIFTETTYMTAAKDSIYAKALKEIDTLIFYLDKELKIN